MKTNKYILLFFKEVLQSAYNNNILLIAASGNNGQDNILYPARYDTVIAVGAIDSNDNLASFSSYGFEQELVADGIDINSTSLGNSYSFSSGTSMAAPHVAGAAALIKSFNKSLTNEQIRAKLRNTALDLGTAGKDDFYGYGLVQVNLNTSNFTLINLSYFYEIFNISNFGLPNITFTFWLNGTGTIDDVDFMLGYYLVNITFNDGGKKSRYYYVNENGTLKSLIIITMGFHDNYVGEGSATDDAVVWVGGTLKFNITTVNSERDAECFDTDFNNTPNSCYYKTGKFSQCDTYSTTGSIPGDQRARFHDVCSNPALTCAEGVPHNEPLSTSSRGDKRAEVTEYTDCDNSAGQQDDTVTNNPHFFVIDAKRAICDGTVNYHYEGRYGGNAGDWRTYKTASCSTTCDSNLDDQIVTSESGTVPSPCTPPAETPSICNGTISAIVTDSKSNPLTNARIYRNGIFNGSVDNDGSRTINFTNVDCGSSQTIEAKCSDDSLCDTKSTSIDSNGDYDSLSFSCNICINKTDLSIKTSEVSIKLTSTSKFNITALINVEKVNQNNVVVDFRGQDKNNQPTINESKTINISQYVNQNVSVLWDSNKTEFVSVFVDFTKIVAEIDEGNNYIKKSTRPPINAYIEVTTDYPILENTIKNFLGQYVNEVSSGQEVNIYVGRKNSNIPKGQQETDRKRWKYESNIITYTSKSEGLPYNGIVARSGTNIYVFGNEIDGDFAALRKLVDNQEFYFSKSGADRADYVSEEDLDGLFVFDYLHTDENQAKYRKNNANFAKVVENVLNSNVYSLAIKRVLTYNDNTSLRIKHINAELSPKFKNFSNPRPIILGHGLFGDLFAMEKLGLKIATDQKFQGKYIRDTWLIEYSGGPNTECNSCPNYTYGTLVDYYWPALVGGVLKYSNNNKVDYVGYSAGGGIGLKSYEKYYQGTSNTVGYYLNGSGQWVNFSLPANFVEQMALIAPMAAFNGATRFTSLVDRHGNQTLQRLANRSHLNRDDINNELKRVCSWNEVDCQILIRVFEGGKNISYNFLKDIINEVQNKSNLNPKLSNINRLSIIYGAFGGISDDIVVPDNDISYIYSNSNATKKYKGRIYTIHKDMQDNLNTYDPLLSKFLNNRTYNPLEHLLFINQED